MDIRIVLMLQRPGIENTRLTWHSARRASHDLLFQENCVRRVLGGTPHRRVLPMPAYLLRFLRKGSIFLGLALGSAQATKPEILAPDLPHYTVTVLGEMPRASADVLPGLNSKGDAAFWKETPQSSLSLAAWKQGKREDFTLPDGYKSGLLCGVNAAREWVGWVSSSAALDDSKATIRAVHFQEGRPRLIGTLGGEDSEAYGIGAKSEIIGISALKGGMRHAFVETKSKMTDLGTLAGGKYSVAYAVNAKGEIVGGSDENGKQWAVVWRRNTIRKLEQTQDAQGSQARGINDNGQVVGYIRTDENETHAFLHEKGKMTDLGTLGDEPSVANSINNQGVIVGASNNSGKRKRAFLYQNAKMTDLNTLLPADTGFLLQEAFRINDVGQILCLARDKERKTVLVLLTPQP